MQLIYTVSQTSRWRWLCADVLRKRKAGRNTAHLVEAAERDIARDPAPIGRYNVAPGTKVLLLNERDEQLHLDAVYWGYARGWWDKPPLINARVETAASSRMFKPLWEHGRAICFADGWFEWKKEGNTKQPYFIQRKDGQPILWPRLVGLRSNVGTMPKDS